MIGKKSGRPSSDPVKRKQVATQLHQDECDRNAIEGKFGQGKRRYQLGLNMNKLSQTGIIGILLGFITMNLDKRILSFSFVDTLLSLLTILNSNNWFRKSVEKLLSRIDLNKISIRRQVSYA